MRSWNTFDSAAPASGCLTSLPRHDDLRLPVRRRHLVRDHGRRVRRGITFFDTADVYPLGGPTETVGPHRGAHRRVDAPERPDAATTSSSRPSASATAGPQHVGPGQQSQEHHAGDRRVAPAARHRLRRPVPDPLLRSERPRSTRRCRRWTTSSGPARCATSAARTRWPTSSPGRSVAASCTASAGSRVCSPATTCCSARTSASCSRCAPRRTSP